MGKVTERYDWRKLLSRARHVPIAQDKRAEGRAILAGLSRILTEASDDHLPALPPRKPRSR